MFVALSVEDTFILNVDVCTSFITTDVIMMSCSLSLCFPLATQAKLLATAVQVNSATALMETLTARGGMVIPAETERRQGLFQLVFHTSTYLLPVLLHV